MFSRALDVELEKISSFYGVKEKELFDESEELLRDVTLYQENGGVDGEPLRRPSLQPSTTEPSVKHTADPRSSRSVRSAEDGADDSDDEDDEDEDDETAALNKRRSSMSVPGRRRTLPNAMYASADLTASVMSTDFTRSLRRYSTGYDDYAETARMFSSGIMLKKRIVSLYVQLCELKSYIQLNKTGFRKVLKKFDKITDRELRLKYMETTVETSYPFIPNTIKQTEEYIQKMVGAYTDIVTQGDEALAKKDLRSHLREHVVWERNTVWRDLIGLERRAEAASVGGGLLGGRGDGAKLRLQGDEPPGVPTKEIHTPLGHFTYPTWLFGSTMFTFLGIVAIFSALLFVPIMEKPEQQSCLAMLVFVSLLWATEVSQLLLFHYYDRRVLTLTSQTIPLFVTSLSIPFLCVVLRIVKSDDLPHKRLDSKEATVYVFAAMWTPVIMLLLGGFTIAAALSKCKIDKRIATFVLSKAGTRPRTVIVANMFVAAFASMLVSNVAAPVLCFSIIEVNTPASPYPVCQTSTNDNNSPCCATFHQTPICPRPSLWALRWHPISAACFPLSHHPRMSWRWASWNPSPRGASGFLL